MGPLSLAEHLDEPFLVLNGDVLTDLNLNQFVSFIAASGPSRSPRHVSTKMDFGVIEETDGRVTEFREKPELSHLVSMGIYCIDPVVLDRIPSGVPFGFDDLMFQMLKRGYPLRYSSITACGSISAGWRTSSRLRMSMGRAVVRIRGCRRCLARDVAEIALAGSSSLMPGFEANHVTGIGASPGGR